MHSGHSCAHSFTKKCGHHSLVIRSYSPTQSLTAQTGLGSHLPARNDGTIVNETSRSAGGREREPESRGGAAVPPDGAEADVARPNRADAAGEDRTDSSIHRVALPPPCPPKSRVSTGAGEGEGVRKRRRPPAVQTAASLLLRPRFRTAVRRMLTSSSH